MSDEFLTVLKALKLPLLSGTETDALRELESQWSHWTERERRYAESGIAAERKEAFAAFVADPVPERERLLLVLADEALTAKRYAALRLAFAEMRGGVSRKAGELLSPVVARIHAAIAAEHERRLETAEPVMSSKRRNPVVIEASKAADYCDRLLRQVHTACTGEGSKLSPLQLADVLLAGASDLTGEDGQ